jgi:acetaldehyde dehydrogenase (acetylating)
MAGNATSDNVGPQHLMNIKRIAWAIRTAEEAFPDAAPVATASTAGAGSAVLAAVEKYLAQRGLGQKPAEATPVASAPAAVATAPAPVRAPASTVAAEVVDRFLARRPAKTATAPTCACGTQSSSPKPEAPAEKPLPPAPEIQIVDFVCESDVRAAIQRAKKIYIGPKTIVTPSARELASAGEILVMAQR